MKPLEVYKAVRTVLFTALAILVIVFLNQIVENLRYFIGALILFYGVEEIVFAVFREEKHYYIHSLYWNIIEIVLGLALILFAQKDSQTTLTIVCVAWATWSILREEGELVECTQEFKKQRTAIFNILESLTVIAFSVVMLIDPTEHHAKTHLYLLSVDLFTKVFFPLLENLIAHTRKCPAIPEEVPHNTEPTVDHSELADESTIADENTENQI